MGVVTGPARRPEVDSADVELVRRIRAGERAAVEALYQRFRRPAYALARRILADDGLAEDVVQDVFVAVWRDPAAFDRSRGSVAAWLLGLVHLEAVDAVRREEPQLRRRSRADDEPVPGVPGAQDGEDDAGTRAVSERVRLALSALPSLQREALTLAYHGGYTQREIAALTGAPLGTVKTRTLAGMRRLREELGGRPGGRSLGGALGGAAVDGPAR